MSKLNELSVGSGDLAEQPEDQVRRHLLESASVTQRVAQECAASIVAAAKVMASTFRKGGKILLCGNGGSAADCQHVATEFTSRLTKDFVRPGLPAIALTTDTSFLTAYANDVDFETGFARQVQALGKPGDTLIGISTSGNSANVLRAVETAKGIGMATVGLLGEGGRLTQLVDVAVVVPSRHTLYTQEALLSVEHVLCYLVERAVFAPSGTSRPAAMAELPIRPGATRP